MVCILTFAVAGTKEERTSLRVPPAGGVVAGTTVVMGSVVPRMWPDVRARQQMPALWPKMSRCSVLV